MRRAWLVILALLTLSGAAIAQTRQTLETYNNNNITSNGQGLITGPIINSMNGQIINGAVIQGDTNHFTGANTHSGPETFNGAVAFGNPSQVLTALGIGSIASISGTPTAGDLMVSGPGAGQLQDASGISGSATITRNIIMSAPAISALSINGSMSGTCSSGICGFAGVNMGSDSLTNASGRIISAWFVNHNAGGGLGGYVGEAITLNLNTTTLNLNDTGNYVGSQITAQATVNDNGTGSGASASGKLFGRSVNTRLTAGATNWDQLKGDEIDVGAYTGTTPASVNDIIGLNVVQIISTVSGSRNNTAIAISNDNASNGWTCAICIGDYEGYNPMVTSATLFGTYSHSGSLNGTMGTVANGIWLNGWTFTGKAFSTIGWSVDGSGNEAALSVTTPIVKGAAGAVQLADNGGGVALQASVDGSTATSTDYWSDHATASGTGIVYRYPAGGDTVISAGIGSLGAGSTLNLSGGGGSVTGTSYSLQVKGSSSNTSALSINGSSTAQPIISCVNASPCGVLLQGVNAGVIEIGAGIETLQFGSSSMFTANGVVATAMSSLGPTGSHITIQEWFTVKDSGGTIRYVPAF